MPLISTSSGELLDAPGLLGLGRSGIDVRLPREDELCELPEGATLQFLEGRQPVVRETAAGESFPLDGFLAAAVQLPSGYCRTLLPAYEKFAGPPYLPFFGYTAVFARGTKLYCAAVQTDNNPHWEPKHYSPPQLEKTIAARIARQPENRVLGQLKTCALEYGCYNAQNIFLNRWEGAVPVSPACNAQCVGCISEQPDDLPASPQTRFKFVPTENEIVELGLEHLRDPDSIFSFGQGCEGEPLLQGDLIARTVKSMRAQTNKGTLHLNTNASRPVQFAKIVEAGLDSVRVSLNSLLPETYTSYYQPRGYEFKALLECMEIAKTNGVIIYLNYLHIPGWNDRESEVEALSEAVERYGIQMIQMRNLNIDPELYLGQVAIPAGEALGIKTALDRLRAQHPSLRIGNHTLPKKAFSKR